MLFKKKHKAIIESKADASPEELIASFVKEIELQEDLLYGVALFFEGVSLLHAGNDPILKTYHKQFRNVIQAGRDTLKQANSVLEQARKDPAKVAQITNFSFSPCRGYPEPEKLAKRASILVDTYMRLYPDRPRSQDFTEAETVRLIEASAIRFK
jgi:hypothetical protein